VLDGLPSGLGDLGLLLVRRRPRAGFGNGDILEKADKRGGGVVKTAFTPTAVGIKAIGVGGGGCNAVNRMVRADVENEGIYIRFSAVRDGAGKYLGCVEVSHPVTHSPKLEEKRPVEPP